MIFVRDKGRMCNNILQYGHVYAWAREHGRKAISMRFSYKYRYFNICHTAGHNFLVYVFAKYAAKMGVLPVAGFHSPKENSEAMSLLEHRDWLVVEGWEVRFYDLFIKYKQEIINLFSFDKKISNKTIGMMDADRRPDSIKLGVHVRRGDYKTWNGGRYYYSDEQYADVIRSFASLYKDKEIDVYVCGNAPDLSGIQHYAENEQISVHIPYGNPAEDLCMLSHCDYIIGPPSTFSLVASMYHDVPLHWIHDPKASIAFDKFEHLFRNII